MCIRDSLSSCGLAEQSAEEAFFLLYKGTLLDILVNIFDIICIVALDMVEQPGEQPLVQFSRNIFALTETVLQISYFTREQFMHFLVRFHEGIMCFFLHAFLKSEVRERVIHRFVNDPANLFQLVLVTTG